MKAGQTKRSPLYIDFKDGDRVRYGKGSIGTVVVPPPDMLRLETNVLWDGRKKPMLTARHMLSLAR